jgi:hypothetical protein
MRLPHIAVAIVLIAGPAFAPQNQYGKPEKRAADWSPTVTGADFISPRA